MKRETQAIILDYLPHGRSDEAKREPIAQAIGNSFFTLFELVINNGKEVRQGTITELDFEKRVEVQRIKNRIKYDDLTPTAKNELDKIIKELVKKREEIFVYFLNNARPLSIRSHSLELIPGIGKKHLEEIIKERDKKKFENFAEVKTRIPTLQNLEEIFSQRIIEELKGTRYYLFTKPIHEEEQERPNY